MIQLLCTTLAILVIFAASAAAQVDIAEPGESGFGLGAAVAFQSGSYIYGGNASFTVLGYADLGLSYGRAGGDGGGISVSGAQLTLLPLRTSHPKVRWGVGGLFSYEKVNVKGFHGGGTTQVGALLMFDASVSAKADFQLVGAFSRAQYESTDPIFITTVSLDIVSNQTARKFFAGGSVSIPNDSGANPTFGFHFGFFIEAKQPARGR